MDAIAKYWIYDIPMPELPDITAYLTALEPRIVGQPLEQLRIASPLLLRTAVPRIETIEGRTVTSLRRIGKRIVFVFDDELFLVLHLMIAGRLHWKPVGAKLGGRNNLAAFDFPNVSLTLTEAGTKRRASLHLVQGEDALAALDPGGREVFDLSLDQFRELLTDENRTLKRALTDPRILSGIGNAYSDEILHAAQLSPILQTRKLTPEQWQSLYTATRENLQLWIDRFNTEAAKAFPEKVTAFRPDMAAHGRFNQPCPRCGSPIQRIRFADNETNYCPTCQTAGKVLADRSLSRLLGSDWPRTLDELEALHKK
jgi:formamidopyrimidine-DNA glycosylase